VIAPRRRSDFAASTHGGSGSRPPVRSPVRLGNVTHLLLGRVPGQLVIQYTDRCNARCPQCSMRVTEKRARTKLSVRDARRVIDHAAASGFKALSLTGGEPLIYLDEICELLDHAGRRGMNLTRTGTNGFLFANPDRDNWRRRVDKAVQSLAATPLRNLWISLDSADAERHERLRGLPGVIRGIERALPLMHAAGLYPAANLGINRYMGRQWLAPLFSHSFSRRFARQRFRRCAERSFAEFFGRAVELGFTAVNVCYPMSFADGSLRRREAAYAAGSAAEMVRFSPAEKALLYDALADVIRTFRSRIRVFTPISSLRALSDQHRTGRPSRIPCRGGTDFFFVDCRGAEAYPCGYRASDRLGRFWEVDFSRPPLPADCTACDWECFRDPSELLAPFLGLLESPLRLLARCLSRAAHAREWRQDLRYFRSCDYFDGRRPADLRRLASFTASPR